MVEAVVIGLRALGFILVLQAAGIALYLALFAEKLVASERAVRSLGKRLAIAGVIATAAFQLAQPTLMAGTLTGVFDGSLQTMALQSDFGVTHAIRIIGLLAIAVAIARTGWCASAAAVAGAVLVAVSFASMGHTATHELRWLLAPLLILHVLIVAFWFGSLPPLYCAAGSETTTIAGRLIERFSTIATWLVPVIFVAGLLMAVVLLPTFASIKTPYGYSVLAKAAGFAVLMLLAAANKWSFGPRISLGDATTLPHFRLSVLIEGILIAVVLVVTAVMTALFSVGH